MPPGRKTPVKDGRFCVTRDMRVQEIIALSPQAADIMTEYGLHCFSCSMGGVETLEEGCGMHGMTEEMVDEMVDDINTAIAEAPKREWTLTVTPEAAEGIAAIARTEGRSQQILRVVVDETGGFCLEFADAPSDDDLVFPCPEKPEVRVCVPPIALQRIGGGTIDMRDNRFKLDVPGEAGSCRCTPESCGCTKAEDSSML